MKVKYLNKPLSTCQEVAVVGSSEILLEKERGKCIDEFQYVFRFNRMPIIGYEKYVGSQESIRVANCGCIDNRVWSGRWEPTQPYDFIRTVKNATIIQMGPLIPHMNKESDNIHKSSELFIADYPSIYKDSTFAHPSIGFATIFMLIKSGIKPHVFGFNVLADPPALSHYFEKRDNVSYSHNIKQENDQIYMYAALGLIKLWT